MKSYWYWQAKGYVQLAKMEKHSDEYHASITDVPSYFVLFFYVFMVLIAPKREYPTKD